MVVTEYCERQKKQEKVWQCDYEKMQDYTYRKHLWAFFMLQLEMEKQYKHRQIFLRNQELLTSHTSARLVCNTINNKGLNFSSGNM